MTREEQFRAPRFVSLAALAMFTAFLVASGRAFSQDSGAEDPDDSSVVSESTSTKVAEEAIDLYLAGDAEGAYKLFERSYLANPDSDPPGVLLALLHSHAGRLPEMRRALEQTAEDYPWTDEDREKYIGGKIMAAKVLSDHLTGREEPCSEENWIGLFAAMVPDSESFCPNGP